MWAYQVRRGTSLVTRIFSCDQAWSHQTQVACLKVRVRSSVGGVVRELRERQLLIDISFCATSKLYTYMFVLSRNLLLVVCPQIPRAPLA